MHKVLLRQIKTAFGDREDFPKELKKFLEIVSLTYDHSDEDRLLLERTLELTSGELMGINRDIEKKIEIRTKELQNERATLIASINSIPIGIILIDLENNIRLHNGGIASILGLGGREYTFTEIADRFPPQLGLLDKCKICLAEKRILEFNNVLINNKFVRVLLSPIIVGDLKTGDVIGNVFLIEDVTKQKLLDDSKDAFVAIAAHELRTPLTIIRGEVELLLNLDVFKKQPSMQEASEMLSTIHENTVRLMDIVNSFLDVTMIEDERAHLNNEEFDVTKLITEVVEEFQGKARAKNLSITFEHKNAAVQTFADRNRTKEILINLISNGLQYTDKGDVKIIAEKNGEFARITISDTGCGITPEMQPLLFGRFQTVTNRFINSKEYGSGMGLYITKLLTELMGGRVRLIKSVPNAGSEFEVLLPSTYAVSTQKVANDTTTTT